MLVLLEDHVDALADVDRDGDLGSLVQELEPIVLLRRDVDGGRNLLPGHLRRWPAGALSSGVGEVDQM